jgi:uncharacterized membrane protein
MKKPQFSKKEALKFGFNLTKKNILFFVGVFVIVVVFSAFSSFLKIIVNPQREPILYFIFYIALFVINMVIGIGVTKIALEFVDGKKPKFSDLWYYKPILNYFIASLIQGVIVTIGFILLIIPGIILSIRLYYTYYLIIDKNLGFVEAIKKSWAITRGNTWNLFFFGILIGLINILGALCLIVGLFVTVPLSLIALTFIYRKLLLQSEAA